MKTTTVKKEKRGHLGAHCWRLSAETTDSTYLCSLLGIPVEKDEMPVKERSPYADLIFTYSLLEVPTALCFHISRDRKMTIKNERKTIGNEWSSSTSNYFTFSRTIGENYGDELVPPFKCGEKRPNILPFDEYSKDLDNIYNELFEVGFRDDFIFEFLITTFSYKTDEEVLTLIKFIQSKEKDIEKIRKYLGYLKPAVSGSLHRIDDDFIKYFTPFVKNLTELGTNVRIELAKIYGYLNDEAINRVNSINKNEDNSEFMLDLCYDHRTYKRYYAIRFAIIKKTFKKFSELFLDPTFIHNSIFVKGFKITNIHLPIMHIVKTKNSQIIDAYLQAIMDEMVKRKKMHKFVKQLIITTKRKNAAAYTVEGCQFAIDWMRKNLDNGYDELIFELKMEGEL